MHFLRVLVSTAAVTLLCGCGSTTKLGEVWRDDAYDSGAIRSILVVGVGEDDARRRFFEGEIGRQFEGSGVVATAGSSLFPPGSDPEVAEIRAACVQREIDAVLVTTLLSIDTITEHVAERKTTEVDHDPHYTTFSNYYKETKRTVTEPGYSYEKTTVHLENRIYDVATEALIWSASSETFNPKSTEQVVDDVGRAILGSLTESGLIAR